MDKKIYKKFKGKALIYKIFDNSLKIKKWKK